MKKKTISRYYSIANYITNTCGVNSFLVIWKEKDSQNIPCCELNEDNKHVSSNNKQQEASRVCQNSFRLIQLWMTVAAYYDSRMSCFFGYTWCI